MMAGFTGWALWREPGEAQAWALHGPVMPQTGNIQAAGYWVQPFEAQAPLVIQGQPQSCPPDSRLPADWPLHPGPVFHAIDKDTYLARLQALVDALKAGAAKKVVICRKATLPRQPFSMEEATAAFWRLCRAYPKAFCSLVSIPTLGTWVAATPETLCRQVGTTFETMSLAGTRALADSTPWLAKEYREQDLVTGAIIAQLDLLGAQDLNVAGPQTVQAGAVAHLQTKISFTGEFSLQQVASALHPTPAVGGLPLEAALRLMHGFEGGHRGLYAGYVGYLPAQKADASLYVHLRCACLTAGQPTLFAGGGILPESDPLAEWQETEAKLQVLMPYLS